MGDITSDASIIYTYDQLLRQRAIDEDQTPLFAYPKSQFGVADFEFINGRQLNRFVDGAVKSLRSAGLHDMNKTTNVGVFGLSDLDYLVNIYALGRLGYTSFLISPRLPASTVAILVQKTKCPFFLHSIQASDLAIAVKELADYPLNIISLTRRTSYDIAYDLETASAGHTDLVQEQDRPYIRLHSSGSTGLPKTVAFTNKRLIESCISAGPLIAFISLPFSHAHGLVSYTQAVWTRKTIYLFNPHVPQTNQNLCKAIRAAGPEIFWAVPYILKLLAETEEGIDCLKRCKVVSSSGSVTPDELGDRLTKEGVFLGCHFASTETMLLFTSITRPRPDTVWNYLRPLPHALPYILMRPISPGNEICECIVLDGLPGKEATNSDDPPNSYHTSDLFIAHSTIPNAWKFVGRADDRITLLNGEKMMPVPFEGTVKQHHLVREAVMFGINKPIPGLLLFRANTDEAKALSDDEYLDKVWPMIEDANFRAEAFSQIGRDLVAVLGADTELPVTDKSSIKRAQLYRAFSPIINEIYSKIDRNRVGTRTLAFDIPELESWLTQKLKDIGIVVQDSRQDLFSAGVDSLKAIQMQGSILQNIDVGNAASKLPSLLVYSCGNIEELAKTLHAMRTGEILQKQDEIAVMKEFVERYSVARPKHVPTSTLPKKAVVILTGATGFLGSHVLAQLIPNPDIDVIYCLIRRYDSQMASSHLRAALEANGLSNLFPSYPSTKVVSLSASLHEPMLGLSPEEHTLLSRDTTHIIHCAWAVNFSISLYSFSSQLVGLRNLLDLSLSPQLSQPAKFVFCSSVAVALGTPPPAIIPSEPLDSFSQAAPTGYGRSKLVAEKIVENYVAESGAKATILRIGQILPSRREGRSKLWNVNEMIPLMVRSATVPGIASLPEILGTGVGCQWIEVDVVAEMISRICGFGQVRVQQQRLVYNLLHPNSFSWRDEFLPRLKEAGMVFEGIAYSQWLEKLRDSEPNVEKNPSRMLLKFWEARMAQDDAEGGQVCFDTGPFEEAFEGLRRTPAAVDGGFVQELVDAWKSAWLPKSIR